MGYSFTLCNGTATKAPETVSQGLGTGSILTYHRDGVSTQHHGAQELRPFQKAIAIGNRCGSATL